MIVRQPERITTAPEGTYPAVCVDEIPLGRIKTSFNGEERERDMVRLVWQVSEVDPQTKQPYTVRQDYTASLDEKAKLRKHLQSWRGKAFTAAELFGFELENIVGVGCLLNIVHRTGSRGGTFANVEAIMKMPQGMEAPTARGYIRVKDRAKQPPTPIRQQPKPLEEQPPDFEYSQEISDEEVPF